MKSSKYNVIFEHSGKKFAFNCMTYALAEVTYDFFNILDSIETLDEENLDADTKELVYAMKEGNYIIEDNDDELSILKFRSYYGKFNDRFLNLTILPNLQCNFACPYCYEGLQVANGTSKVVHMSNDVKEAIYKQVQFAAEAKSKIGISWYGGEPTLSKDIIIEMSNKMISICDKYGVEYVASMTSNGFLSMTNSSKKW
ncbi:MAG: 4Fe-4S cluster-binding domain-containing protein [Firmicutes bacterium]|nr:4Fe-4S cluster-binding domain-containing protein [Bacillota bacterium]